MKKYLPLLILLTLTTSGLAWPFGKKEPKPTPKPTPTSVSTPKPTPKPTLQEGRELVKGIASELNAAKTENAKLKASLAAATSKIQQAEAKTAEVQKSADALKEWGIQQQVEAQKYFQKYTDTVKRYHKLKMIAAIIAAAAGVLLGLQFMNVAPPPYNLGVPVGAAALFAALVWFFL
jgi:hypothetical protein